MSERSHPVSDLGVQDPANARPCPLCGEVRSSLLYEARDYRTSRGETAYPLLRCDGCHLIRIAPWIPLSREDGYTEQLDARRLSQVRPGAGRSGTSARKRQKERVRQAVWERCAMVGSCGGGKILDIGCGAGDFLAALDRGRWTPMGVERSHPLATLAQEATGVPILPAEPWRLPFPAAAFDVATAWGSFEHFDEPIAVLREVRRVLQPGGRAFFLIPNARGVLFGLLRVADPPRHRFHFTAETFLLALEKAGFDPAAARIRYVRSCTGNGVRHAFKAFSRRFSIRAKVRGEAGDSLGATASMSLHRLVKLIGFALHPLSGVLAAVGISDLMIVDAGR